MITTLQAQKLSKKWERDLQSKVLASPILADNTIYVGVEDGTFYALDETTGIVQWEFETKGNIQAKALVVDEIVFFESANIFYALNRANGKLLWKKDRNIKPEIFEYKEHRFPYKLDPYDDKRSTPTYADGLIYAATTDGKVLGLEKKTGEIAFEINADDNAPIRSSPLVQDGVLYFGDWNGIVYAYHLEKQSFLWQKKTYRNKFYMTFGGIASEFLIQDSLLIFGARNQVLNALYIRYGQKEWTFSDQDNGWLIGDPVVYKDTIYIGGSDNFSMYAIQGMFGQQLWKHNGGKNIYTKPIVTDDWLIYTAGNAYNYQDIGMVYWLDRKNGAELAKFETPNGIFSSPVLTKNGAIVFGCSDGKIRSLEILEKE